MASKSRKKKTDPQQSRKARATAGSAAAAAAEPAETPAAPSDERDPLAGPGLAARAPGVLSHPLVLLALSAASGALWFLAVADFDISLFAWFAMVPLMWAAERAPTRRRALAYGFVTGLVGNCGGFYWIIALLERFGHLPWIVAVLLFLLLAGYQGIVFMFFAWVTRSIRRRWDLPMTLVAPLVISTFELVVPMLFPFYLSITQAWQLHVIQIADLGGPIAVTALLLTVNGAIYDLATAGRRRVLAAFIAASILLGALGYGDIRIRQADKRKADAPKIQVGLVQPNVSFDEKGTEHEELAAGQLEDLQRRSRELEAAGADLVVWTESSYPYPILRTAGGDYPEGHPWRIREGFQAPLVLGAVTWPTAANSATGRRYPYNSALLLEPDGRFAGRFDKIFLLMFGEYIPGLETFPSIRKLLPQAAGHFARGKETVTFPFHTRDGHEYRLGPMICYEDIIPRLGRKLAALRPHLLVNITNDAWFGDTSEPWEHLALSVFRAVELRTSLVRAVNTGVSAFVDPTGRVYAKTYAVDPGKTPRPADKILAPVALIEGGHTLYAAVGDLFAYLCAAATAALWLIVPWWRRRRARRR